MIPTRLVQDSLIVDGALGSVKGCSHLGNRAPGEAQTRRPLLSLPTSASAGRPESRSCLVARTHTDAVEAPRARLDLALFDVCHEAGVVLRTNPPGVRTQTQPNPFPARAYGLLVVHLISSTSFHTGARTVLRGSTCSGGTERAAGPECRACLSRETRSCAATCAAGC